MTTAEAIPAKSATSGRNERCGVLLVNTGSPDAPEADAVREYLAEFLSDKRVIELPAWKWMPILHGIILRTRPAKSAERYKSVWLEEGSPLIVHCRHVAERLQERLGDRAIVGIGMRYGRPSVSQAMDCMTKAGIERILVLPMFAQYAAQTSAACMDAVFDYMRASRNLPSVRAVRDYCRAPEYIDALVKHISAFWDEHGRADDAGGRLLLSFHGIPQKSSDLGDPYEEQCRETARTVAARLGLADGDWGMSFQSRFGRDEWLKPYTLPTAKAWAREGLKRLDVACPGFAADCLETIEEIDGELRGAFMSGNPDGVFHYIPALNDSPEAVDAYEAVVRRELQGWM